MKRCNTCERDFEDQFNFCPVDGAPIEGWKPSVTSEFKLTLVNAQSLPQRLAREISFLIQSVRELWPEFKQDPIGISRLESAKVLAAANRFLRAPHAVFATLAALTVVLCASLLIVLLDRRISADKSKDAAQYDQTVELLTLSLPSSTDQNSIGVGADGRVGLNTGRGEGSADLPRESRGGGGSGDHDPLPSRVGKVPQPATISAALNPPLPQPALAIAGVDLDPALFRNLPYANYGDPLSRSNMASKGPGQGASVGNGNGLGFGDGDGDGVGPGNDGNMGGDKNRKGCCGPGGGHDTGVFNQNQIIPVRDATDRPRILSKPEPQYTDEARRNQITGTVILQAVFSRTGEVTNIRTIKSLPAGLTEKAIAAALRIRFVPAIKNGQPVSVYMQLEYNFNLY